MALVPKKRIALEAISFSLDSIEQSYTRLINILSTYQNIQQLQKMQRSDRINVFSGIWSIIDNGHAIIQLMHGAEKKTQQDKEMKLDVLVEAVESETNRAVVSYNASYGRTVGSLRNQMDHLSGNLNKLSNKKASQEPLFGTLSYILSDAATCGAGEFDVVAIASTGFTRDSHKFSLLNPADIRRKSIYHPVDHIQFSAFDSVTISITDLVEDSLNLRKILNTDLASNIASSLRKYAEENNLKEADVFQTLPGEFFGGMRVKMMSADDMDGPKVE